MKQFFLLLPCLGNQRTLLLPCAGHGPAQQALTWDQVKAKFEAANPTLKADSLNVDEMKAEEITAFLRPNPQFTAAADGTQIAPDNGALAAASRHAVSGQRQLSARARSQARAAPAERQGRHADRRFAARRTWNAICSSRLRSAFVQTLQAKAVLELAKADLEYYDHIIQISRDRFNAGDIAQIDLDRIELLRVQYESEIQTAIVNLRTAKIQLLQLLNDRTPVEQFDVTGPFDFSDDLKPLEDFRQIALDERPDLRAALESIKQAETNHKLADGQRLHRSDLQRAGTRRIRRSTIPYDQQTLGPSVSIPLRIFDRTRARSSARRSTSTATSS